MYLTGGIGTAQYGDEGFGDPYLLPNKTYRESCASIANVMWQHRMNLIDGGKPVKLTAIPYFAWANRGKCPMNLWIRESKDE